MDLAQALNAPVDLPFAGRVFRVRQLRLAEWADLQSWLKQQNPSPLTAALLAVQEAADRGQPISDTVAQRLYADATERSRHWPPRVASGDWLRLLSRTEGGQARFLRTVLTAGGQSIDDAEAQALMDAATQIEVNDLVRLSAYGDPPAPKTRPSAVADTAPATATATATTAAAPTATTGPGTSKPCDSADTVSIGPVS